MQDGEVGGEVPGVRLVKAVCSKGECGRPAVGLLVLMCNCGGVQHNHVVASCETHLLSMSEFLERTFTANLESGLGVNGGEKLHG